MSAGAPWRGAALAALAALALAGCETTAERSARIAAAAGDDDRPAERGLRVARVSRAVRVVERATVADDMGVAVVVTLRGPARAALAELPIAIDVRDAGGRSLFRNDDPGAERGLVSLSLLAAGRTVSWVHDQVPADAATPARVRVRVGEPRGRAPARPPRLTVGALTLARDVSGTEGRGRVTNHSTIAQRDVPVYAVARRGGRVVAAARAIVARVGAGASAPFSVYFVGDPRGARISLSTAPTVLR